jgi:predicted DNA-binding protein
MAAGTVTSVRIPPEDLERLDQLAKRLKIDRSSLLRRAIDAGVREVLVDDAVARYQKGEVSAWYGASSSGVNLWQFLDEMKARGVPFRTDEELLEKQLEELRRARRRR